MSSPTPASTDGPLAGGTANRGRVVRVGDWVHRPLGPQSRAVHTLFGHLDSAGFDAAPRLVGTTGDREVLTYIEGTAAIDPIPSWAQTSSALVSVGRLLRRFHACVESFDPGNLEWQRQVPARWRGATVTHNDVNPSNTIFRNGRAVALIDFDLTAPGCPAWDLAIAACNWIPLRSQADIHDSRCGAIFPRFRCLLDGYGADRSLRQDVVAATVDANLWISAVIEESSQKGHPAFGRMWAEQADVYHRAQSWLNEQRDDLYKAAC